MSVDYDLVVIGGSAAGIHAAISAAHLNARVVLVEQGNAAVGDGFGTAALAEVGQTLHQMQRAAQLGLLDAPTPSSATIWTQTRRWAETAALTIAEPYAPAVLAALGIEVITGQGEFHRKPTLGFVVNGRSLRSRTYLLALETLPVVVKPRTLVKAAPSVGSKIDGLAATGYLTADSMLQNLSALASLRRLVIIGNDTIGVELAQSLVRLGRSITLIVSTPHILPRHDPEAALLIQAQLEADGVEVLTGTTVTQVRQIDGQKWVQAGNRAIDADDMMLTAATALDPATLNLAAANVDVSPAGVWVNAKLQTTNPRIYACRSSVDGDRTPQGAIADATIALRNALFWPIATANHRYIPSIVATNPPLARVGLSESAALQQFGKNVMILRQPFKALPKAQLEDETTGFCKLLVHRNGEILGAHIVGSHADEIISPIALAMQQKIKIQAIANLVLPSSSIADIIHQTAAEWHRLRLQQNPRLQDLLEGFFNWRRSIN